MIQDQISYDKSCYRLKYNPTIQCVHLVKPIFWNVISTNAEIKTILSGPVTLLEERPILTFRSNLTIRVEYNIELMLWVLIFYRNHFLSDCIIKCSTVTFVFNITLSTIRLLKLNWKIWTVSMFSGVGECFCLVLYTEFIGKNTFNMSKAFIF
ncbi:hypothetical protein EVB99_064 [Rhizobium phage RHph_N3_19]|nr:hypothetical protein EVB99_064 [Rhizobium phage RHph_N3_19]